MHIKKSASKIFIDCICKCSNTRVAISSVVIVFSKELRKLTHECPTTIGNIKDIVHEEI